MTLCYQQIYILSFQINVSSVIRAVLLHHDPYYAKSQLHAPALSCAIFHLDVKTAGSFGGQ